MDRGASTKAVAAASTSSSRPRKGTRDTPVRFPAPIGSSPVTFTGAAADVAPRAVEAAVRETIHRETEVVQRVSASDAGGMSVSLPANKLLTAFEVAELVGCHEESVRRAYLCGQLKRQRFGVRSWRFRPADVEDWIRRGAPTRIS